MPVWTQRGRDQPSGAHLLYAVVADGLSRDFAGGYGRGVVRREDAERSFVEGVLGGGLAELAEPQ
jgi:hypothetical protein